MTTDLLERSQASAEPAAPAVDETPSAILVAASAFLATAAAGWAAGGLFEGVLARPAAIVAAAMGTGVVTLAQRSKQPALIQALGIPAIALGALLFALAGGARGGPVDALTEAVRGGGPSGEPMPFVPGWRLLLVLLVGSLAAGATALAVATGRTRLAVFVPVPALVGASLVQPRGATIVSGVPAMAMLLAALVVSFGVELTSRGASSGHFEVRRIARGIVAIAGVAALLVGIGRAGALFPIPDQERVIPPRLPPDVPPTPDRVLFTVRSTSPGPWRFGVLDVYDGSAWRLPPYDPARLEPVARTASRGGVQATFTVAALSGSVLPGVAEPKSVVTSRALELSIDPRTGVLRLASGDAPDGLTYTVSGAAIPSGRQLAQAAPLQGMREFLEVPQPPAEVGVLLADAPAEPLWDRLQYVRTKFYRKVVAAGAGKPVAVPPARAGEILSGQPATPYELTAAEVLLARWAGIPARIGYGFYAGDRRGDEFSLRPRHAATWLETYFEGYGWIPIVGVPPRARASLDREQQQANPLIRPTQQLALVLYVPVRRTTIRLFYAVARYWIAFAAPFALALIATVVFYPGALKAWRRARRRRWGRRLGYRARIGVAYAELRDAATDLGIADPRSTPMGFARAVAHDDELAELTWLVSRGLWGDLTRDLQEADAAAAERMARSVEKRIRGAQPAMTRTLAIASRASLRDPYSDEVPNLWPSKRARRRLAFLPFGASVLVLAMLASCGSGAADQRAAGATLPDKLVPAGLDRVSFRHEPAVEARLREAGPEALIDLARVFTFSGRGSVQGYLEIGSFRAGITGLRHEVRRGVLEGIGAARFKLTRVGLVRIYAASIGEQDFALWFAPEGTYFELLVMRRTFGNALDLLARVLEYQGRTVGSRDSGGTPLAPLDPRRGEAS